MTEGLTPGLDVGCGEGELARHLPAGAWIGLDSSPEMLARAPNPKVLADATKLPYVLYHLPDPRLALAEAARVVRPGGMVAVAVPAGTTRPSWRTCFRGSR